jgi:ABC-type transport system involved in cytochrome c biogenesis permease subunit
MPLIIAIPFYAAILAYCIAAGISFRYVQTGKTVQLTWSKHAAALGNTLLLVVFVYRWIHYGLVPFTGLGDSLNLLIVMSTGIILIVQRDQAMKPTMMYYMPALAMLALVSGLVSPASLSESPKELNGPVLIIHVGLVFFAFALFIVSSLTSMAYITKAQSLKRIKNGKVAHRLPSLERIDKTLYGLIGVGYPAFAVTLVLGFFWAFQQRDDLGPNWMVSPRIILALVMVIFYGGSFHIRRMGLLRGPKLAYLVFFVSMLLFFSYLGIELMQMGGYNSGGDGS